MERMVNGNLDDELHIAKSGDFYDDEFLTHYEQEHDATRTKRLGEHQKLVIDKSNSKFDQDTIERVVIGDLGDQVSVEIYDDCDEYIDESDDECIKLHRQKLPSATSPPCANVNEIEDEIQYSRRHSSEIEYDAAGDVYREGIMRTYNIQTLTEDDDPDEIYRQGMVGKHKVFRIFIARPLLVIILALAVLALVKIQDRAFKNKSDPDKFYDPLSGDKNNIDPLIPRAPENLANICDVTVVKDQAGSDRCYNECMVGICCIMLKGTAGHCFVNSTQDNCSTYKPCESIHSVFGLLPDNVDSVDGYSLDHMEGKPDQDDILASAEDRDIFKVLADVCGLLSWATESGKADCRYYCKSAKCCFSSVDDTCFGDMSQDLCPIYTPCTVVYLDNDNDDVMLDGSGMLGSTGSSSLISQIESSVTEYCDREKLTTPQGEKLCADMCIPAQCCFASGAAKCTETKDELCPAYAACGVLYRGVEMVQQVCTKQSYHGDKADCEMHCDPARCCFNGIANSCWVDMNVNLCYAYSPCAIVYFDNEDITSTTKSTINAAETKVSDIVTFTCQTNLLETPSGKALCKELCFPATCCFATNLLNCLNTNPQLCLAYDGCKVLYNKSELLDALTDPASANPNPEEAALLIHVLVSDACSTENISTVGGRKICIDLCSMVHCCFDKSPNANCWTDRVVYCNSFSDCGILGNYDFDTGILYDVQASEIITEMVKDACSPASLEVFEGKQLCREICIPGQCCFEDDTCEFDKRILCTTYKSCSALGQDDWMDMQNVLIPSTNLNYSQDESTMFKAPQVVHIVINLACSKDSRNTDDGMTLCEEVCIPAACCYASDNYNSSANNINGSNALTNTKGSCLDKKLDMCSIFADCGYLYVNNWDGTIADKTTSDLPFSPSISTIVQDACKEESLATPEGMNICKALCVIPACCFLYENNCWDEYHAMCTSYSPCQVMFQVSVLDDDAIASSPQEKVVPIQAACSDDMIELDGGDLCQEYCQPHMCCFAESGSGHECTDISDCGQYAICNMLIDKFTKLRTSTAVAMIYDIIRNQCGEVNVNNDENERKCVDLCIPSRCCFSINEETNCNSDQSALCSAYSYCGIFQDTDFAAVDKRPSSISDGREGSTAFVSTLISGIVVETCSESNYETTNGKELCDAICTPITACCFGHQDVGEPGCALSEPGLCATFTECWIAYAHPPETSAPSSYFPTIRPTYLDTMEPSALPTVTLTFMPTITNEFDTQAPTTMMPSKIPTSYEPTPEPTISEANKSFYFVSQTVRNQCESASIMREEPFANEAIVSCMEVCIPAEKCLDNLGLVDSVLCLAFESCVKQLSLDDYAQWGSIISRLGSTSMNKALVAGIAVQSCSDLSFAYLQGKALCEAVCFDAGCCFDDMACDDVHDDNFCEVFDGCWRDHVSDDIII